mgnify:CR=1 FL=1
MVQLSTDSFLSSPAMMPIDAAIDVLRGRLVPVAEVEHVPVAEASGRILASDVVAPVAVPAFDNSAVDGYAVCHADLAAGQETVLPISGRVPAGTVDPAPLTRGTAVRIFTGAPMPQGADTVFMQEDTREVSGAVSLPPGLKPGANRRFAGEDFAKGTIVLAAGRRLRAPDLAALSALGLAKATVRRRLKAALFSTGDEIVEPGQALRHGAQYDSNRTLLADLLRSRGVLVTDLGILPDRREAIGAALDRAALGHDIILTSGGVSTGEEDHVKQAVEERGALSLWRLAIKPGRPVAMGTIRGAAFIGLPGNPVASFVTFVRFAGPLIDHLGGAVQSAMPGFPGLADFHYTKKAGRREFLRGSMTVSDTGQLHLSRYRRDGAALISSLIASDGLIELDEATIEVAPGTPVRFVPFAQLMQG